MSSVSSRGNGHPDGVAEALVGEREQLQQRLAREWLQSLNRRGERGEQCGAGTASVVVYDFDTGEQLYKVTLPEVRPPWTSNPTAHS